MTANDTLAPHTEVPMTRRTIAAALLLAATPLIAEEGVLEKTIPFPRRGAEKVDLVYQKCTIQTLEARNYPDQEDIEKARANDPKDHSWIWWQFELDNRGPEKFKIKLSIEVLDKAGTVVTKSDRGVTIDGFASESYRISGRMRTLDAADSPKVRVRAQFIHDKK
jgi:hypothetical protein